MLFLDSVTMKETPDGRDDYPFSVPALRHLERLEFKTPITFFAGNNGSGKSTLLEGLAAGMTAYAIGNHGQVKGDLYLQHAETVAKAFYFARKKYPKIRMFLRAEDVLGYIRRQNEEALDDFRWEREKALKNGEYFPEETPETFRRIVRNNSLDRRSHGEGFLDIMHQRVHGAGLYFLDEPESPLSPQKQLELAALIRDAADSGGQLIIATHSPVLLAIPEATVYYFDEDGITERLYDELENISFLRRFLDRPSKYLSD
ncbi:AAA family ATPase [Agrobacterium tumefaciens]|uniref:AAA family ATPase n=1 Tax=Agrobacterium tumefaciens TaxID=358 RepID=UPI001571D177|nr:AAA family ATPase [Agrobacterium tumefaciens]NTE35008.1 AAA family ATPase [Agrobacterium tumefaciens]NTE50518.1 AAA family ATPase [Agrobacterium tumefaciens]